MSGPIILKIDVLKIPKEAIFQGAKGKYVDLIVYENDEPDRFDNTHSVALGQTREQRDRREKKIYVGNGRWMSRPKGDGGQWDRSAPPPRQQPQRRPQAPPAEEFGGGGMQEDDIPF